MHSLDKTLRNRLERTIKDARDVAEAAAHSALGQLGVGHPVADKHLGDKERALRNRLRVHGRQLGDKRNSKGEQEIGRLIEEVAYEHWHRMLFARFLAENDLLMYPDLVDPVAVTLEECDDLAVDEGAANGWELAARFASRMLPQIFRLDSPVFQLTLPPEYQQKLEHLVADLPLDVFIASDSLGWVYQFWQAKKKDEVNASEVKIGARELPAVTQLFTEPYMVGFLLDNSLGAWWAAHQLSEADLKSAGSEEELRSKAAIPGVPLDYLRFVLQEDGTWTPAAGAFDGWPEHLSELKTLDPCCGSGHFLVSALLMLVPMRMELEDLSAQEAVDAVLRENLHGLELDQRCVELAAFALALTAWKYPDAEGYRPLTELNLACSGLSVSVAKEEWKQLGLGKKNLSIALDWMHDTFRDAPVLGSLLNPAKTDAAKLVQWDELSTMLTQALKQEQTDEQQEVTVVAQGLAKAANLLADRYQWVVTNVPYLGRGYHCDKLASFCEKYYPAGKNDLATVFLDRCLELCYEGGTASVVLTQNWLFLTTYEEFRKKLLRNDVWNTVVKLGGGAEAFHRGPGNITNISMVTISRGRPIHGLYGIESNNLLRGLDVSASKTVTEKAKRLISGEVKSVEQAMQLENPDARITLESISDFKLLNNYSTCIEGLSTGDSDRFIIKVWEVQYLFNNIWVTFIQNVGKTIHFGARTDILRWENGCGSLHSFSKAHNFPSELMNGHKVLGGTGIRITQIGDQPVTLYSGDIFGKSAATLSSSNLRNLPAIWCYCTSKKFTLDVRTIDQKLNVTNATLIKVPFDLDHWTKVAEEKYPNGLPKPYSNDPAQWIFHGHPCGSVVWDDQAKWTAHSSLRTDDTVLQVAIAHLLGYRWPTALDANMELANEQRQWVSRCEALLPYADKDGIVCIPPVRGEATAADRLLNLLAAAYSDAWSNDIQAQLLKNAGHADKTLETWLRDKFFTQHCKLFQNRPFIWHIWDGLRDGFSVLVNYHKFDAKLLETLIYNYLGDWISRQKQDINNGVDGAEEKLAAAEALKKKLELILKGEAPHDIFVRWKPIEQQPIGWNPDINDGVRMNIRPFMTVGDIKKKGAGILRDKPNIKWGKDRGKDVESAPWYHLGPEYGGKEGDRINDHHLSLAEKKSARHKEQ